MWEYSSDLFDHTTAVRMTEQYTRVLLAGVKEPDTPLWRLPMLGATDAAVLGVHGF